VDRGFLAEFPLRHALSPPQYRNPFTETQHRHLLSC
jgi:hypothetical protein